MTRPIVLVLMLALAGCDGSPEESVNATTADAIEIASKPFTIGNTYANEMGENPSGEFDEGTEDPYERMARDEATANAATPITTNP